MGRGRLGGRALKAGPCLYGDTRLANWQLGASPFPAREEPAPRGRGVSIPVMPSDSGDRKLAFVDPLCGIVLTSLTYLCKRYEREQYWRGKPKRAGMVGIRRRAPRELVLERPT